MSAVAVGRARCAAAVCGLAGVAAMSASAAAAEPPAARCGALPGRMVAADAAAVVSKTRSATSEAIYWGCAYRTGRVRRLARLPELTFPGPVALGGTTFAFAQTTSSEGESYGRLAVVDLASEAL